MTRVLAFTCAVLRGQDRLRRSVPKRGEKVQRTINNGILGDARGSSAVLGRTQIEMKVESPVAFPCQDRR